MNTTSNQSLPNKWETIKLEDLVLSARSGGTPKADNSDYYHGDIPFVKVEDITASNKYLTHTANYITKGGLRNSAAWIVPQSSIMYSMYASVGFVAINKIKAATNQAIINLVPNSKVIETEFLYYFLKYFKKDIYKYLDQTTQANLNAEKVRNFKLCIPVNIVEQGKIAEALSIVDSAIEDTDQLINKYKSIKQGLMQDLFRYGIDEKGQIRSEKTHKFKDSSLGRIPEEWNYYKVSELIEKKIIKEIQDGNHGELHPKEADYVEDGVPFIMATDISNGYIDFDNCKKISRKQYKSLRIGFADKNDVLLSHKASIGFVAVVPDWCTEIMLTPQVTYYRINKDRGLDNLYLSYFFQSGLFQKVLDNLAKQSTRSYIGILMQRTLPILLPNSINEQKIIAEYLLKTDETIKREEIYKQKLLSVKQGLMNDLLTGTVRVNHLIS